MDWVEILLNYFVLTGQETTLKYNGFASLVELTIIKMVVPIKVAIKYILNTKREFWGLSDDPINFQSLYQEK